MSFNTALSGLNAAQAQLSVTSNNIANVNTTGFKQSRAELSDIFAQSGFGGGSNIIGSGVVLSSVAQQFKQGNLEFTSNALDLAVSGEGFFVVAPNAGSSERIFTRAGAFGVDSSGFIVNSSGHQLQVFPVNELGTPTATSLDSTLPLQLPQSTGAPAPTSEVDIGANLPAGADILDPLLFDADEPETFTSSTSVTVFDSLGDSHVTNFFFLKTAPNTWAVYSSVDGNAVDLVGGTAGSNGQLYAELSFDPSGNFTGSVPASITTAALGFANGSDPAQTLTFDFANNDPTQYAAPFSVSALSQNGYAIGRLSGLNVSEDGIIQANYTNGQSEKLGKIALSRFPNPQGLEQLGNTSWRENVESGPPIAGEPGSSSFGIIKSAALETSNVDLTAELVNLITSQRNFQANAKSIETSNAITQTIIGIR